MTWVTRTPTSRWTSGTGTRLEQVFKQYGSDIAVVIHTAAQPSHDWAAKEPFTDFDVNAGGTLNMLENTRQHAIDAPFIHCSTNKVYGDRPNSLPLVELETRWELARGPPLVRRASPRRCRSTTRCTRSSAPPRSPRT